REPSRQEAHLRSLLETAEGSTPTATARADRTRSPPNVFERSGGRGVGDDRLDAALHALRCLPTGRWRRCVVYPLVVPNTDRAFTDRQPFPCSVRLASNRSDAYSQQPRPPSSERPGHIIGLFLI